MISLSEPTPAGVPVVSGAPEFVVCIANNGLQVRDQRLVKVLFSVKKDERVKPMQSWGANKMRKKIRGKVYTFIKAQFPDQSEENNVGWVAEMYVKAPSACPTYTKKETPHAPSATDEEETEEETESAPAAKASNALITGLNDEVCCVFPTIKRPTDSYMQGMRRFGAGRSGGRRLHAAADLYRVHGEVFESVAPGRVIRNRYYFYQGTYALEVKHAGGFVARYGEITGRAIPGAGSGATVKAGQQLGYISTVNSGCCNPMLHFELYSGRMNGPLNGRNAYQRRADLLNPSQYLRKWEKMRFGTSY
jgi:murein DD-endopeptidase MepM/ murein hydrolase activator NlpD